MSDKLSYSGQFVIDNLDWIQPNGLALDIREHFEQITIYEDIFAPFTSGNIIMRDTLDLANLYLRAGLDMLRLRIYTPSIPEEFVIDKFFHIYKIDERDDTSDRSLTYLIHFISKENVMDQATKISRTFKGTAPELANTIAYDYLQIDKDPIKARDIIVDPSNNVIQYTSNFWTPTKNLSYIAERAIGEGNLPSYLFFENRDGFNLREMTSFASKDEPIMQAWNQSNYIADVTKDGQIIKDFAKDYISVQELNVHVNYDHMKDMQTGLIQTRVYSYDFITKTFRDRTANINDSELPLLNAQRFYSDTIVQSAGPMGGALFTGFSHFNLFDGAGSNSSAIDTFHKRNVIMRAYQQHKIEITVFGRTDYTVGKKASFEANKMRNFNAGTDAVSIIDNLLSGDFIVSAVRHRFSRDGFHEAKVELMKDSIQLGK